MRALTGIRYVRRGSSEGNPALVALGSAILLGLAFRKLAGRSEARLLRRRLKEGQGLMVRVASPQSPPPERLRRVR